MQNYPNPLITFALFTYNQERFITDAVQGALNQTYSPLEIILSDDCSSDRTFEIIQAMAAEYQGPHRIVLNKNEKNLGLVGHINHVMEMASGELIVAAAGDDISKPNRTEKIYQKFVESGGKAFSIFSTQWDTIDERGNSLGKNKYSIQSNNELDYIYFGYFSKTKVFVPGHSHAWHRSVFDVFGPIDIEVISEDVVIPFRAALLGKVQSINDSLVIRRFHSLNLSGPKAVKNYRDKLNWYKKHRISRINNMIGIARTFLADMQTVKRIKPNELTHLDELTELNKKYLMTNRLEIEYIGANVFNRLRIITEALIKYKMPITRLVFWIFGAYGYLLLSSFPINSLYLLYKNNIKINLLYKLDRARITLKSR